MVNNLESLFADICKRQGIAPFGFDEDRGKEMLAEREARLQDEIRQTVADKEARENKLKYSNIPSKFRDMSFGDLVVNDYNEQLINHCSNYVKNYERHTRGIGLIGEMGVGKTTLMALMGQYLAKNKELGVYFATEEALLDEVKDAFDDDSLDRAEDIIRRIGGYDVVMIDELGQTTSEWGVATLKRIVDTVINNRNRLFVTTNYNSDELNDRWGGSRKYKTPMQLVDRMAEAMDFYMVKGESFRRLR